MPQSEFYEEALMLLSQLIETKSISREESDTANLLQEFIRGKGFDVQRLENNVWTRASNFDSKLPTILLNSHHDTVKPSKSWTFDPFIATSKDGKIYGLGSNDAGASLVSLLATFLYLDKVEGRKYNLIFAATAEEEVSGQKGAELLVPHLGKVDLGIVGEPTQMQMAIAEKGLMVLDCTAYGKSGHAARDEGVNAIYKAIQDIEWFRGFSFPKQSELLGSVKMTVSMINAGSQHNVVPDKCGFVVDVRTNECYSNEELFKFIEDNVDCDVVARSFRLNSSSIPKEHPIVKKGVEKGFSFYGSPTMSDQVFMPGFPTLKIGPGDSARSHTADEFIMVEEVKNGIDRYIDLLLGLDLDS